MALYTAILANKPEKNAFLTEMSPKPSLHYIFIELISRNVMSGWGRGGPSAQKHISTSGHWLLTLHALCFYPHYPPFSAKCLFPRRRPLYIHLVFRTKGAGQFWSNDGKAWLKYSDTLKPNDTRKTAACYAWSIKSIPLRRLIVSP